MYYSSQHFCVGYGKRSRGSFSMKAFVRWYGKVLEGEVLEGEWMGMKQVRIPLDSHCPVALFMPQHVYDSPEKLTGTPESPSKAESDIVSLTPEQYVAKVYVTDLVQRFKDSHWDEAHNHIRVDSLDEFYQIWRKAMTPSGFIDDMPASAIVIPDPQPLIADVAQIVPTDMPSPQPSQRPAVQKPSRKMLRSTGEQKFIDATQLALFD